MVGGVSDIMRNTHILYSHQTLGHWKGGLGEALIRFPDTRAAYSIYGAAAQHVIDARARSHIHSISAAPSSIMRMREHFSGQDNALV